MFKDNHPELVGGEEDPANGPEVAATIFIAVIIYAVRLRQESISDARKGVADISLPQGFLVFCGLQGLLHLRENRRGAIAL